MPVGEGAWQRLGPARTNLVWKVPGVDGDALVIKLFVPTETTPLFPNEADSEWSALVALQGSRLAPEPVARSMTPWGPLVVSAYVSSAGAPTPRLLGVGLRDLHERIASPTLRRLVLDRAVLVQTGRAMIAQCDTAEASVLTAMMPDAPASEPLDQSAFLHGDPVPSNVLDHDGRAIFVDWQCPASGDPVFDLACALSPSMRLSCDADPFTESEIHAVLQGYGDAQTAERFHRWRAVFAWRFACYAAWCGANGRAGRAAGLHAELELLERLRQ